MGYGLRTASKLLGFGLGRVEAVEASFRSPVFMGDEIRVEVWPVVKNEVEFRVMAGGEGGKVSVEGQVALKELGSGLSGMKRWE